jgi:acetyl esterase
METFVMPKTKLDPQIALYLKAAAELGLPPLSALKPAEVRGGLNERMLGEKSRPEEVKQVEDISVPGYRKDITLRLYTPRGEEPFPVLIFMHGGGWVIGNLDTHDSICRQLANLAFCTVVSVDYHLAPEHKFPEPLEDCYCALQWVWDHCSEIGGEKNRIAVGGDSAGGNMAASITHLARDRGLPALGFQLLIYPALSLIGFDTESHHAFREGYGLSRDDSIWFCMQYLRSEEDGRNSLVSPLLAENFSQLPPAHIVTAGYDMLRDDGTLYFEKLQDAGVPVTLKCYEHLIHGVLNMDGIVECVRPAIVEIAEMLKRGLS